jgi:hypothetical protein
MSDEQNATGDVNVNTDTPPSTETPAVADPLIKVDDKPAETPPAKEGDTPPADAKPEDAETGKEADADKKDETPREGAPETYEPFTMPEGVKLDEAANTSFMEIAKKHDLSQPAAQEMIDLYVDIQKETSEAYQEQLKSDFNKQLNDWAEEAKTHPDIGGANFEANKAVASQGLNRFFNEKAIKLFEDYGFLHNADVVAGLMKVGTRISEDKMENGDEPVKEETYEKHSDVLPQSTLGKHGVKDELRAK